MAEENDRAEGGERIRKGEKGGCEGRERWAGREGRKQRKAVLCPVRN